jgi:hypothetical protein
MACILIMPLTSTINITHMYFSHVNKSLVRNTLVTMFSLYCTVLYRFLYMECDTKRGSCT